jgi:hypothetical protein
VARGQASACPLALIYSGKQAFFKVKGVKMPSPKVDIYLTFPNVKFFQKLALTWRSRMPSFLRPAQIKQQLKL